MAAVPMTASREMQVLLACSRVDLAEQESSVAAMLRDGIDWLRLIDAAERHGTIPLLHRHLAGALAPFVPGDARDRLRKRYLSEMGRALLLHEELGRLLRAFAAANVDVLAYKGPALEAQVYRAAGLRSFGDLDLLVRPADFARGRAVLEALGFRPLVPLTATQERAASRTECDQAFVDRRGAIVELHWAITPPYFSVPLATDDLFARAVDIRIANAAARVPGIEDVVLLIAINGAKDCWSRIEPLCVLYELLRHAQPDWPVIVERARNIGGVRMLALALALAERMLGATLPNEVSGELVHDAVVERLIAEVLRRFNAEQDAPTAVAATRFRVRARERWQDRVRHVVLRGVLPTREDCAVLPLPAHLWPVAALVRPLRLMGRVTAHVTGGA